MLFWACENGACPVVDTGDGVWTPASAGVTTLYEIIKKDLN